MGSSQYMWVRRFMWESKVIFSFSGWLSFASMVHTDNDRTRIGGLD